MKITVLDGYAGNPGDLSLGVASAETKRVWICSRLAPIVSARCFAGVPRCVSSHNQFHKRGCGSAETKQLGSALTLHSFSQEVVIVITPAADV